MIDYDIQDRKAYERTMERLNTFFCTFYSNGMYCLDNEFYFNYTFAIIDYSNYCWDNSLCSFG